MISTVLESVKAAKSAKDDASRSAYWALIHALCDGSKPTIEEIEAVAGAVGKTIDALTADAELVERRRAFGAKVAAVPELTAERASTNAKIGEAVRAFEAAQKEHEKRLEPLTGRIAQIDFALQDAESARQQLRRGCPYGHVAERHATLKTKRNDAHEEFLRLERRVDDLQRDTRVSEVHSSIGEGDAFSQAAETRASAEQKLITLRPALAEKKRKLESLEAELAEAEAELLTP